MKRDIKSIINELTLEEKASLCSGLDTWNTKPIERLGIPSVMLSDGPHGLRKQESKGDHLGFNESIPAVCFPSGSAIASSFNRETMKLLGKTLALQCQAVNVSTLLGPAMNIKRSPLAGRNFEYLSEDPYVSSELATAYVKAVQKEGVATSPKHFLANNQENQRMTSNSVVDERTLREIYLASFEKMVKEAKPWTIMNSYNLLNGTYMSENQAMLTGILRDEWGFEGYVMTDWGAMTERVDALKAGCELEMPGGNRQNDKEIVLAVREGRLDEEILNQAVERLLTIIFKTVDAKQSIELNLEKDHEIARQIAEDSFVLLKNDNQILPLNDDKKIAYIGKYAKSPRYQGGGSSHVNSFKVDNALSFVENLVTFAEGFDDKTDILDESLLDEAVEIAKEADIAVLFVGLPDSFESEGYDRKHMRIPLNQQQLIEEVSKVQPNTVVVLHNGAPIEMPWIDNVKAVLEVYLGGQAVGSATHNVLFGKVNPSGKLAETFPLRLEDTPSYLTFGGENNQSVYSEGIFVGYRYYTSKAMEVLFPFGHGLSYTTFEYDNLTVDKSSYLDNEVVKVSVEVSNTGERTGKEVVQLYVGKRNSQLIRPIKELKSFEKIELQPGETKIVSFELDRRSFANWDIEFHEWSVEEGEYELSIGNGSESWLETTIIMEPVNKRSKAFNINSTIGEIMKDDNGRNILEHYFGGEIKTPEVEGDAGDVALSKEFLEITIQNTPLRQLISFIPEMTREMLEDLISELNKDR